MGHHQANNGEITFFCGECELQKSLPLAQVHKTQRCKGCKSEIPPPARALSVDTKTFEKLIRFAKVPVFVDFWASWCAPCKKAAPEVERLAAKMSGAALVLKVDTEAEKSLAAKYSIRSIPNFMIFKKGKAADQRAGLMPAAQMETWLKSV